jgi:hypothetical protein
MSVRSFALAGIALLALAAPAFGEDKKSDKSSEFSSTWFGLRVGLWYQPSLDLQLKVGGSPSSTNVPGLPPLPPIPGGGIGTATRLDVTQDLGIKSHEASPVDYFTSFRDGIPEAELFFDTRWLSVSFWGVSPFRYQGEQPATTTFNFGGLQFQVSREVRTTLDQFIGGADVKINLLNNELIRVSPIAAVRALGIDWTIEDVVTGTKATTSNTRLPISVGRYQVLPYPELGAEVRVGYRSIVEVDLKGTAMHVFYSGLSGTTALVEFGVTVYPLALIDIENLGIRLGYRYYLVDIKSQGSPTSLIRDQFDTRLELQGANLSAIVRF